MVRPSWRICAAVACSRRKCSSTAVRPDPMPIRNSDETLSHRPRTAVGGLASHVVGDRNAVTRGEFVAGLAYQHATAVGREQYRHVVMRRARHERKTVNTKQRRTDRGGEQLRLARARNLRGDLMLHPIDD